MRTFGTLYYTLLRRCDDDYPSAALWRSCIFSVVVIIVVTPIAEYRVGKV